MRTEDKQIQQKKKTCYNVYGIKNITFHILTGLMCAAVAASVLQIFIRNEPPALKAGIDIIIFLLGLAGAFWFEKRNAGKIIPYKRENNFEFIGLYDLSKKKNLRSSDILSRETEADYLSKVMEHLIFPQSGLKQSICLTGRSGCGKSTILSFFRQKYADQYEIHDFSGDYMYFLASLKEEFGNNLDQEIMARAQKQKIIFILDQFERFFFLEEPKRDEIRGAISVLCRRNTGMILSMREEYLTEFLKEFDINNMKNGAREKQSISDAGILNNLTAVIRDDRKNYNVRRPQFSRRMLSWKTATIKDSFSRHLEAVNSHGQTAVIDPVGNTIFYCENQNEVKVRCNGTKEQDTLLQSKCEVLFGKKGRQLYEKHKNEPLIQQQIIYHMMEYEKKVKEISVEELQLLFEEEDYEILKRYFDIQLTASGSYFHASRILYILSQARINHVVINTEDLEYGLFADQFSRNGHKEINFIMRRLEELQLIRRNIRRSDQEYEIAHDFVAQAFLTYSNSSMDRNVKSALDIYMAEYLDANRKDYIDEKRAHTYKVQKSTFYRNMCIIASLCALAADITVQFIYNPWQGPWKSMNVYGNLFTFVPLLMTECSIIYMYNLYAKVLQFYRGKKERTCRVVYTLIMLAAVLANLFYPHCLFFYGAGLAAMGVNGASLLDGSYQKASRMEMRNYALKCSTVGLLLILAHGIFWLNNSVFPIYLIFIETVILAALLAYSYLAHMTREYLYGRRMDASSDRGEK